MQEAPAAVQEAAAVQAAPAPAAVQEAPAGGAAPRLVFGETAEVEHFLYIIRQMAEDGVVGIGSGVLVYVEHQAQSATGYIVEF